MVKLQSSNNGNGQVHAYHGATVAALKALFQYRGLSNKKPSSLTVGLLPALSHTTALSSLPSHVRVCTHICETGKKGRSQPQGHTYRGEEEEEWGQLSGSPHSKCLIRSTFCAGRHLLALAIRDTSSGDICSFSLKPRDETEQL